MNSVDQQAQALPYDAIPYVTMPDDYQLHLGDGIDGGDIASQRWIKGFEVRATSDGLD
ncbi:hypothetical protein KDH_17060 [Dictyobacter sp. S3.2.2.5]|uniref:Uncharacterized protein n=1 Tax=Dictyobacter halimunensis TaxID=3026934 RepID=A0ABQ6FR22_9CHLR|nr:hypothetical protein KDH_17060 [Dictyobacter sp. S3.2.2.5]